jgi:hypothetical protein
VNIIDAFGLEWTSTHERDVDRPITIYHILLVCFPASSSTTPLNSKVLPSTTELPDSQPESKDT